MAITALTTEYKLMVGLTVHPDHTPKTPPKHNTLWSGGATAYSNTEFQYILETQLDALDPERNKLTGYTIIQAWGAYRDTNSSTIREPAVFVIIYANGSPTIVRLVRMLAERLTAEMGQESVGLAITRLAYAVDFVGIGN